MYVCMYERMNKYVWNEKLIYAIQSESEWYDFLSNLEDLFLLIFARISKTYFARIKFAILGGQKRRSVIDFAISSFISESCK